MTREEAALQRCHELLAWALGRLDPDQNTHLVRRINAELQPCDDADSCPIILTAPPAPANNATPSVPMRGGEEVTALSESQTPGQPGPGSSSDATVTVEGELGEAGALMAAFDEWKANDAMCSGIVNPYLVNVMRYVWAAAATRNLRVVEACETCKGNGHALTCPVRSQYSGYLSCCHGCPACAGTGRKA